MKRWLLSIAVILLISAISFSLIFNGHHETEPADEFFFGVSFGGNSTSQAKLLIDKVKNYTNFFLISNWDVSMNQTALNEISQYAVDANMNIMVYFDFIPYQTYPWIQDYLLTAKQRWGEQFLGIYLHDEPGGKQIDSGHWRAPDNGSNVFENVSDYTDAANRFVEGISSGYSWQFVKNNSLPVFTSDYALYWFDYLAGYDTIFVELGWGHNPIQHIGMCRGAAKVQNKDWGAIIVWNTQDPDDTHKGTYKTGPEMFDDMVTAYTAGAKYIVVFNYPYEQTFGILEEQHFTAMETFWNLTCSPDQENLEKIKGDVAFVLPKDYGWGMRHPEDKIWMPIWGPNEQSELIWSNMNKLIAKYELRLDIIFDDARFDFLDSYSEIYYWDSEIS
ncbi:MAG: hypothetical protein IAX21_08730 [Candidatus Bathyarchaeota archaeon]|nr:MAG: hypothetical protein IAX21_08730 [Candidatus Bathyarchaeota archaeon]